MAKTTRGIPKWARDLREKKQKEAVDRAHRESTRMRFKRNDPCMCGSGKKIKNCCDFLLQSNFRHEEGVLPVRWTILHEGRFFADEHNRVLVFKDHKSASRHRRQLPYPNTVIGSMGEEKWAEFKKGFFFVEMGEDDNESSDDAADAAPE